jgi:hypothetical protein
MSAITAAPLGVWDPSEGVFDRHRDECSRWAIEHLPDRARSVVRAEFYLIDVPFAVVHQVKRNDEGRISCDPEADGPVLLPPVTVMLSELPPDHLLGRTG